MSVYIYIRKQMYEKNALFTKEKKRYFNILKQIFINQWHLWESPFTKRDISYCNIYIYIYILLELFYFNGNIFLEGTFMVAPPEGSDRIFLELTGFF